MLEAWEEIFMNLTSKYSVVTTYVRHPYGMNFNWFKRWSTLSSPISILRLDILIISETSVGGLLDFFFSNNGCDF